MAPVEYIVYNACWNAELECDQQHEDVRKDNCSPLVRPYIMALESEAASLWETLQSKLRTVQILHRHPVASHFLQSAEDHIVIIKQSLAALSNLLFSAVPRSQRTLQHYVLDRGDRLSEANYEQLKSQLPARARDERAIPPGVYVFQGGEGDMSLIVTPDQKEVILIDGTKTAECFKAAWDSTLKYLNRITHIFVTHHDEDHTFGIQLLLARYCVEKTESLPDISRTIIYMNTRAIFKRRNFRHEQEIETLAGPDNLNLEVRDMIIDAQPPRVPRLVKGDNFFITALLPRRQLVEEVNREVMGAFDRDKLTKAVKSRGGTTAANVLSINLVAVWNRDAYLFTGDAHLKDVTEAARDFLADHGMDSFKYVDVPHHGSARSNVENVDDEDRGLAGIPAEQYLISHCGNHQNPSFQTVKDILTRGECQILHFLYQERKRKPRVQNARTVPGVSCQECQVGNTTTTENWHCNCVCEEMLAKIAVPLTCHYWECFKFFPFVDYDFVVFVFNICS